MTASLPCVSLPEWQNNKVYTSKPQCCMPCIYVPVFRLYCRSPLVRGRGRGGGGGGGSRHTVTWLWCYVYHQQIGGLICWLLTVTNDSSEYRWLKVMLHWSTCNANLQRRFTTHVFHTNLQTCYTFELLSKTSKALQHCKYRKKSSATGCYTRMIFRATSYRCKLALQVDQCNTTLT